MKKYSYTFMALASLTVLAAAMPVFAQTTTTTTAPYNHKGFSHNKGMMKSAVFGTVSAISGNTITVAGNKGFGAKAVTTTYTVDATSAKITKNNVAGTITDIVVGDTIMAQGTLTGTNLVATTIRDGIVKGGLNKNIKNPTDANFGIAGNGEPVVAGTVSTVSGSTLTITNKSNVTYTVDATNAKIIQGSNSTTATISNIAVGDTVVIQGTVNGTSITASNVIDQKVVVSTTATTGKKQPSKGFFGSIGSFFSRIFGF